MDPFDERLDEVKAEIRPHVCVICHENLPKIKDPAADIRTGPFEEAM